MTNLTVAAAQVSGAGETVRATAAATARVLVADDMPANFELLEAILEMNGFEAEWARTGTEALAKLRAHSYELLLLDMHMPDLGGLEVVRRLRSDPAAHVPKIVVATADTFMASSAEVLMIGADGIFTKPIDVPALVALVESLLGTEGSPAT